MSADDQRAEVVGCRAACWRCKSVVPTELGVFSIPFSDSTVASPVRTIAARCKKCGAIVYIPQSSVPDIKKKLEEG